MNYRTITYDVRGGVAILTLNRPKAQNALNGDMRDELHDAVLQLRADDAVKAVLLTGAGAVFCAGSDPAAQTAGAGSPAADRAQVRDVHVWSQEWANLEKPVVAAVDGPAYGDGFSLALMADFVVATPEARFCGDWGRMGLAPGLAAMHFLPRMVGLQTAKDILLTARVLKPEEALALGIVYAIHTREQLMDRALELAGRFCHGSTLALGMAKNILNQAFQLDQRALAELESYSQAQAMETDYHRAAVARFLDKQPLHYDWEALEKAARG